MKVVCFVVLVLTAVFTAGEAAAQKKRVKRPPVKRSSAIQKAMITLLQGRWASLDDKKTFFVIEGDKQIDIYGRDILDTATINFYDDCPFRIFAGDEKKQSGEYLIAALKQDDFFCYKVITLTAQKLVLMYLPKGSMLRYKKVPMIKLESNNADLDY